MFSKKKQSGDPEGTLAGMDKTGTHTGIGTSGGTSFGSGTGSMEVGGTQSGLSPHAQVNFWNSPRLRLAIFGVCAVGIAILGWKIFGSMSQPVALPKSKAESRIDKIKTQADKASQNEKTAVSRDRNAPDQATGDEGQKALAEFTRKLEAKEKAKHDAEDAAKAQIEYVNYTRKQMHLPHDEPAAVAWEQRLAAQKANPQSAAPQGRALTKEEEQILTTANPSLLAAVRSATAGGTGKTAPLNAAVGSTATAAGPAGAQASMLQHAGQGAGQGAGTASVSGIPGSIDPTTGLPTGSGIIFGSLDDGGPDLDHGAYQISYAYTPPGGTAPVTINRWVRPGYLYGRSRPYEASELKEEDRVYRSSLRAPTEIPVDKEAMSTRIPFRKAPNKERVTDRSAFTFVNRYVTVQPNPYGKLVPVNPPDPADVLKHRAEQLQKYYSEQK